MSDENGIFVATGYGNYVAEGDGFYVSFKPANAMTGMQALEGEILAVLASALSGEEIPPDDSETALFDRATKTWRILAGDFSIEYAPEIAKGLDACIAVYERNIGRRSPWSTDRPDEGHGSETLATSLHEEEATR